ncbi:MAG: hypothetical protein RIR97_883 [Pseudomonadota bacterium]
MPDIFALDTSDTEDELWDKIHQFMKKYLGVTSVLYGFTHSHYAVLNHGFTNCLYIKSSHPEDYMKAFENESFLEDDLCTSVLWNELGPFFWHDDSNWDNATEEQKRRAQKDEELGMSTGVSIGFRFANGQGVSGIGLACRWMTPGEFQARWQQNSDAILKYLNEFDILMRAAMVKTRLVLSSRQAEVLGLHISGLKGKQIASLLGISEKRIEKIFSELRQRLGASSTAEAAAKAIIYSLV